MVFSGHSHFPLIYFRGKHMIKAMSSRRGCQCCSAHLFVACNQVWVSRVVAHTVILTIKAYIDINIIYFIMLPTSMISLKMYMVSEVYVAVWAACSRWFRYILGFLLLRYSVLCTVESLSLLYLLFIS